MAFDEVMHENFKPNAPDFEDDGLEDDNHMDPDYVLDDASMQMDDDGKKPDHVSIIETPVSDESAKPETTKLEAAKPEAAKHELQSLKLQFKPEAAKLEAAKPEAVKGNRRVRVNFSRFG